MTEPVYPMSEELRELLSLSREPTYLGDGVYIAKGAHPLEVIVFVADGYLVRHKIALETSQVARLAEYVGLKVERRAEKPHEAV
jgi:hypothetical protein